MKIPFLFAIVMVLAGFTGCNQGSPGGPGTTKPESEKHFYDVGNAKDTFSLSVPSSLPLISTRLKQGETKTVAIGIKRGTSFEQDVAVSFADQPNGVTLEPSSAIIKRGETEAKFKLVTADDASLGDFTIKVTGHPSKGADASHDFKITVAKK
jgi:hypothetical protein